LSIFTTILASRIGSWQHYLKITSITLQVSMTLVKTDLGFLRIIQKFKIVGRETNNNKGDSRETNNNKGISAILQSLSPAMSSY
jgi:hypothetical protein